MLIPPSLLLILFGIIAETSIGDLFTAGIVPGIILFLIFVVTILVLSRFRRDFVLTEPGKDSAAADVPLMPTSEMIRKSAPIVALIIAVLGGIYGGVFTPTEAGGVGAFLSLVIAILRRSLTPQRFWDLLVETGRVTAAITFLIISAHMYARLLALSGLPNEMKNLIVAYDLSLYAILALYLLVIIALGTILDSSSIILIMLPLVLPIMHGFGVDMVWFGILTIIAVEVGLITPPLGIACFVIKANLDKENITLKEIFSGAFPFVLAMCLMVLLVLFVPGVATVLL